MDILSKSSRLVIGEADFFGTHVCEHSMKYGREVVTLDDLSSGLGENINESSIFIQGSMEDEKVI